MLDACDRAPLREYSDRPTDTAYNSANGGGDAKLQRRCFDVVEIYEQANTLNIACSKANHHVLPVCPTRQLGKKTS
jgi:hypothetical protein